MANTLFSVIIPAYNRADIIKDTVTSVLNQTYTNLEVIVVDDGSTDNTREVVEGIEDSRVVYIYQENAERSAARNNGVSHAKGEYVCFLDSDDFYHKDFLLEMNKYIEANQFPKELIIGSVVYYKSEEEQDKKAMGKIEGNVADWLLKNPVLPIRVCMAKSIFDDYQFRDDTIIVEDVVLWISVVNKYKLAFNPKAIAYWRVHDNQSVNLKNNAFGQKLKGLRNFFRDKESEILSPRIKKETLSDCYLGIYKHHKWHNRNFEAKKAILLSILYYPQFKLKEKLYLLFKS